MKKAFLLTGLALSFAFFFSACQRETEISTGGSSVNVILTLDDTRTVNDGMSTQWEEGDRLSVFYAPASTESYSGNTCFTITDPEACIASGEADLTESKYDWYLLYPYSEQVGSPAGTGEAAVSIGQLLQTQRGNNSKAHLAGARMPLYGVARDVPAGEVPTVAMHQAAAVVAVNVNNGTDQPLEVRRIKLVTPCEIVGSFSLDFSTDEPVYTPKEGSAYDYVMLDVKDTDPIPAGGSARFYIAVKPFTLSAGDKLTLEILGGENAEYVGRRVTLSDAVPFRAGHIINLRITYRPEGTVLEVGADEMTVPAEGGTVEIPVQYNVDYSLEIEASARSWIHQIATRTIYSETGVFQVDANDGDERRGTITFRDNAGKLNPITVTIVQEMAAGYDKEKQVRTALMEIYNAMDGPNWHDVANWASDRPIKTWSGVDWNRETQELQLHFYHFGLKGAFPDCFEGLKNCTSFLLDESGVTGTLPPSFNQLTNLKGLVIQHTSMTGLSDVFAGIPLETVDLFSNEVMTGPLPETLGESATLTRLEIGDCPFTERCPIPGPGLEPSCD